MVFGKAGHAETGRKRLSPEHIEEAARCIDPVFSGSPQYEAEALGDELGLRLVCKVETANPIRSFKGRGTDYLLHRLGGEEGQLVCGSSSIGMPFSRAGEVPGSCVPDIRVMPSASR